MADTLRVILYSTVHCVKSEKETKYQIIDKRNITLLYNELKKNVNIAPAPKPAAKWLNHHLDIKYWWNMSRCMQHKQTCLTKLSN